MRNGRLRIGIVGAGRILPAHLHGYKALLDRGLADFEIVALCARKQEDVDRFLSPGGPPPRPPLNDNASDPLNAPHLYLSELFPETEVQGWTDSEAMIREADLDVVDITATVSAHHPAAMQAFARGMYVMVQKPIAGSVREAREMVAAAKEAGVALGVMENVRFEPTVLMERWVVEHGHLGTIQMALGTYLGTHQWSPDKIVAETPWRHRRDEAGGGISIDLGVHFFQHLRYVCGPIANVYGNVRTFEPIRYTRDASGNAVDQVQADVDDAMFCTFELADGGLGQLSASWAGHGPPTLLPGGLVIYGSKGCLKEGILHLDGQAPIGLSDFFEQNATDAEREALFPHGMRDSFGLVYLDFLTAIRDGRQPTYDGHEGLIDLALSEAIAESSRQRRPLSAEEVIALAGE